MRNARTIGLTSEYQNDHESRRFVIMTIAADDCRYIGRYIA